MEKSRKSSDSSSTELEFWTNFNTNHSFPEPHQLTADELFVDGALLPLHLLPEKSELQTELKSESNLHPEPEHEPDRDLTSTASTESSATYSTSNRWKSIFKKKATSENDAGEEEDKEKRKKKKKPTNSGAGAGTELNIIWPFSRSRSAGNGTGRPKSFAFNLKSSSAPCSQSNSAGESKSKKWPSSPGRDGVHLGRSSPVWQVQRGGSGLQLGSEPQVRSSSDKGISKGGPESVRGNGGPRNNSRSNGGNGSSSNRVRVLNLNVRVGIRYRHLLSCSNDEKGVPAMGSSVVGNCTGNSNNNGNTMLFNLRSLFSIKKVY